MPTIEHFGSNFSRQSKHQAPVIGLRGQPITQQAVVVVNHFFENDIDSRSTDDSKTWGTYSDNPAVLSAQLGEWVLYRPNENFGRKLPNSTVDMTPVNGFTSVNGLLKTDVVRALGICINPSAKNNTGEGDDEYGVTQISGTHTGINMGAETIFPMDKVYLIPEPYYRVDENGRKWPMIEMEAVGYPKDKLLAQTITFRGKDISRQSAYLHRNLKALVQANAAGRDADSMIANFNRVLKESKFLPSMPLHDWGLLEGCYLVMQRERYKPDEMNRRQSILQVVIPLVVKVLNSVYDKIDKENRKYSRSIGEDWVKPNSTDLHVEDYDNETKFADFYEQAEEKLRAAQHMRYNEHLDWLASFYLGTAMNLAPSGGSLDIMLGVGRG